MYTRLFLIFVWCAAGCTLKAAAPIQEIYVNNSLVQVPPDIAPTINATRFVNRSTFSINSTFLNLPTGIGTIIGFNPLPYEVLNMQFFTNSGSGVMSGSPGFRFDYFHENTRERMNSWVNQGSISATTWMIALSDNIVSSGPMSVGPAGLLRLNGNGVNVARTGLRAGVSPGTFFADGFIFGTNYVNAQGVSDFYWGVGTNNSFTTAGTTLSLPPLNLRLPFPSSPAHEVITAFRTTNFVTVPSLFPFFFFGTNFTFFQASYDAFAFTNQLSPTSSVVQVVFIPTNHMDTNLSVDVRFFQNFFGQPATVVVEFKALDFDIIAQTTNTTTAYLIDTAGLSTNFTLLRPLIGRTRRPNNFEIARNTPFEFFLGTRSNTVYSENLFINPNYVSTVVTTLYSGYSAQISSSAITNALLGAVGTFEPRSFPGRIEILGDRVNLNQTRARAESTIIIKARNLVNNKLPIVDAPFAIYDLGSTLAAPLVISNLAPKTVSRLSGQISAYSSLWDNFEVTPTSTNLVRYHVLIVDNKLQAQQPVLVNEFAARATNLVIQDFLTIGKLFRVDARSLTVLGGLSLPFGSSWAASNVLNISRFTNNGIINIPRDGYFGADRAAYATFVNTGSNSASGLFIRATTFDNSGCLVANGGLLTIQARNASLQGVPMVVTNVVITNSFFNFLSGTFVTNVSTNAVTNVFGSKLQAVGDVRIMANQLIASNSLIVAGSLGLPGTLELTVTNVLVDGGTGAISRWYTTGGFECGRLPRTSDLFGTYVTSQAPAISQEVFHEWCGIDYGPVDYGFENNMALGKLTLRGATNSLFHFSAPLSAKKKGNSKALYVDYLELLDNALDYNNALDIDESMTIYFANANVSPEKLNGGANGRLQWVSTFTGPLSSTNIFYASTGQTYTFNIALVTSKDLDSDGDGIPNADDPEPIPVPGALTEGHGAVSVTMMRLAPIDLRALSAAVISPLKLGIATPQSSSGKVVVLSWDAPASSLNYLECKSALADTNWRVVTNFVHGPVAGPVTIQEPVSTEGQRFYRVRIAPAVK